MIVQLVAAIVSQNPYQTCQPAEASETIKVKGQPVLRGILLEYLASCVGPSRVTLLLLFQPAL